MTLDGGLSPLRSDLLSRRAAPLSSSLPAAAPASNLAFDSGHAANAVLPDLTAESIRALTVFRAETLQYAPRPGLPELRARIVEQMAADGIAATRDQVLVTNGAKHAIDLRARNVRREHPHQCGFVALAERLLEPAQQWRDGVGLRLGRHRRRPAADTRQHQEPSHCCGPATLDAN